jgi:ACS family hexuronate transporter-like MFS transporter
LTQLEPNSLEYQSSITIKVGNYRWVICALLFFATTINYVDRQILGNLSPTLQKTIGWNEQEYGYITSAFQAAYAIGLLAAGWAMDKLGTRRGFSLAVTIWSLAGMATAMVHSALGFGIARFALGIGEAANFPASVKTVAEWFPKKERALSTGIFNAGSNVGVIIASLIVVPITLTLGWQWAFIITGALGFVWLAAWLLIYRRPEEHPRVTPAELEYINRNEPDAADVVKIPWLQMFPHRQTWAFAVGKFFTDPVWWFFLFWLPKYFAGTFGLTLGGLALPMVIIYLAADVGSVGGGAISSLLIARGVSVNRARKTALLTCALMAVPMVFAPHTRSQPLTVLLISLAAAGHQGWSSNLYTLVSDTFPRPAVGSVVGIGGMAGALSGMIASLGIGRLLQLTHSNYAPLLTIAAFAYVATLGFIHLLVPRLEPVAFEPMPQRAFEVLPPPSSH